MSARIMSQCREASGFGQPLIATRLVVGVAVAWSAAMLGASAARAATGLDLRVNSASDKATAQGANAVSIKLNAWPAGQDLKSGARFSNVLVPRGAVITSAYLTINAQDSSAGQTVNTILRGQADDHAAAFTTNRADFDSRPRTAAGAAWNGIPAWTAGEIYKSPDISAVISEIVSRPGWHPGNALVIFWEDNGSTGDARLVRSGCAYAAVSNRAPALHVEYESTQPWVLGSLGKTSDGWSGAIPVYMDIKGALAPADYPYARAQVKTPAGETYYTPMAWNSGQARYEGTIYIGSWYGNGCADPNLGAYTVTVQLDNNPDFSSIDYENPIGAPFTTFITRRWPGVPAKEHGHDAEFLPTWNVDHWDYRIRDFSWPGGIAGSHYNVAFAIPFYPTTARITNLAVTVSGVALPPGSAAATNDCWWWDNATHAVYIQKAFVAPWTNFTVALAFDSDTDLFATRIDSYSNYGNGTLGAFLNGLVFANRYISTPMAGGGHELSGDQVSTHVRDTVAENDINIDCAERVAVPVDDVMLADASGKYNLHIKWKQNEWQNYIVSENNSSIVVRVHSDDTPVTGWPQQLTNGIAVERTQTYSAGKRYIKNTYTLTNKDSKPHKYPLVWGREQYIGLNGPGDDKGRYAGDKADRITEAKVAISSLPAPWFTAYDIGNLAAMGVIFQQNDPADCGYFLTHTPLKEVKEWPLTVSTPDTNCTQNTCTFFEKVYGAVAPGASVSFTFWQWGGDFSSWEEIEAALDHDARELNGLSGISPTAPAGAGKDAKSSARVEALALAAGKGRLEAVKALVAQGADVNAMDAGGATPLMRAADTDQADDAAKNMIMFLMAQGAKVNARDKDGNTALMRAAAKGQLEMITFLADQGAAVNERGKDDKTPLMKAADRGQLDVVKALAEKGADVNAKDKDGSTPLVKLAWTKGSLDLFKVLLEKGADVNANDKDGNTPLILAANRVGSWAWKVEWVKVLAEKGAAVDARDKNGNTPLMKAAAAGQVDLVKVLVEKGADVNAKDKNGKTPLVLAGGKDKLKVIEFLKQHGAKE